MPLVVCPVHNVAVHDVKRRGVTFDPWPGRGVWMDRDERRPPTDREDPCAEGSPKRPKLRELFELLGD